MPSKVVRVAAAQLAMKRPLRMTVNRYKKTPQLDKLTTELQKVDDLEWLRLIESELEQIQQNKEDLQAANADRRYRPATSEQ